MEYKGSFIGFTYGGKHSSKLGILRTATPQGHNFNLAPQLRDVTTDLSTIDGLYYHKTNYGKKEIPISFAFYGLSEQQLSQLKSFFGGKKILPLILDEEPYKVWSAKITGTAIIKHTCFAQDGARFYAGQGEITFSAYYPYARSRYEYLEEYTEENILEWIEDNALLTDEDGSAFVYPAILEYELEEGKFSSIIGYKEGFDLWLKETNLLTENTTSLINVNSAIQFFTEPGPYYNLNEWKTASKIPSNKEYGQYSGGKRKLYNAGDVSMPFQLYLPVTSDTQTFTLSCGNESLLLSGVKKKGTDFYILIDTRRNLIKGCDENFKETENLYNETIASGNFFMLPTGEIELNTDVEGILKFKYLYL